MKLRPPNPLVILLLMAACGGGPRSPFTRVTADDGRAYYARMDIAFYTEAGGFLTFRDVVTKEDVRLKNGTYTSLECPREEVEFRQRMFLEDPTRVPMASDYRPAPR